MWLNAEEDESVCVQEAHIAHAHLLRKDVEQVGDLAEETCAQTTLAKQHRNISVTACWILNT